MLATPLSRAEQRKIGRLYVENQRLIWKFGHKLRRKFGHAMASDDISSCVDVAFIKAARRHDPAKGKLSTIFWQFAHGEVTHWLRSNNWAVSAPGALRLLGVKARGLIDRGSSLADAAEALGVTLPRLEQAILATSGVAHDAAGCDAIQSHHLTPWEQLEQDGAT